MAITDLWLPILVAGVGCFILSALVWMIMPHHKSDWAKLPDEDGVREKMRASPLKPGLYSVPHCVDAKEMQKPEVKKKFEEGPVGYFTIAPNGIPPMGKFMALTLIHFWVVSLFVAYLCSFTLNADSEYLAVFRVSGTAAFLAYCGAHAPTAIWFARPWRVTFKDIFDGILYAMMTAGVFGWLWPAA